MAFKQNVNIPMVFAIGLISVMILIVLVLGTQAWYLSDEQAEFASREVGATKSQYVMLKEQEAANIGKLAWVDGTNKQAVTIPIDQAMAMMVQTGGNLPTTQPTTQQAQ